MRPLKLALFGWSIAAAILASAQDGSLDLTFNPADQGFGQGDGVPWNSVNTCSVQPDGKIIFGGDFSLYNSTYRRGVNRVNPDGSLDGTFLAGTGAVGIVNAIALQPDGKLIIGGNFATFNGTPKAHLVRLNADGSIDAAFNPGTGPGSQVRAVVLQADGNHHRRELLDLQWNCT